MNAFKNLRTLRLKSKLIATALGTAGILPAAGHAQQVALLDTGIDPNAGLNVVGGFNYFTNTDDTSDVSDREGEGHGTISARLVAEAFSGPIVPFVVTDGSSDLSAEDQVRIARDNALSDILGQDQIRVVGITWGTPGVVGASASLLPNLSNAGKFVAIMAGNESASQPNALATSSFNLDGVIVVGGTDTEGNLFPTTNRAGTTANRYVGAIGLPSDGGEIGGSSWAAARISGIAGAVLQQNPDLTAQEVADVILQSAEDKGDPGTDNVFGRGVILSAEQVLNNVIGPVTVPTPAPMPDPTTTPDPAPQPTQPPASSGGGGGGGGGAGLLLGGALVGALLLLSRPKTKLERTLVLDSYGRSFEVDLNPHIQINDESLHLNEFFHALEQTSVSDAVYLPQLNTQVAFAAVADRDQRVDMIEYFAMPDDRVIHTQQANISFATRTQLQQNWSLNTGYRVSGAQAFGAVSDLPAHGDYGATSFISGQAFGSVLSGFSSQATIGSVDYLAGHSSKTKLTAGFISIADDRRFQQNSLSTILQAGHKFNEHVGLRVQFGQLNETGSVLGSANGGTFGVDNSTTYALNLSGTLRATEKLSVIANFGMGKTKVESAQDSLLSGFSDLRSDWYSLGVVGNNVFRQQDQVGFAFAQPLKIRSGFVDFALPTSRGFDGDILFDRERVNLSDTGATERSLEGYYRTKVSSRFELGSFISYRQNPNHVADNGNEWMVMATLRYLK